MEARLILTTIAVIASLSVHALTLNVTSGNLESAVGSNTDASSLTLSGSIDVRDFNFICNSLNDLQLLDITNCEITEYNSRTTYFGNQNQFDANSIPPMAFAECTKLTGIKLPTTLTTIGDGAFAGTHISNIIIPNKVSNIGAYAFKDSDIVTVSLPASVSTLGNYAFANCNMLTAVNLSAATTLSSIPDYAFYRCPVLTDIVFSTSTTSIGKSTFMACASLAMVTLPESITKIGESAFRDCTALSTITLDQTGVTQIGAWAFANCSTLAAITIPESLTTLGDGAFYYCTALEKINLLYNPTSLPDFAFTGNKSASIEDMNMQQVTEVGRYEFYNWKKLQEITLGSALEYISDNAFEGCTSITRINVDATTPAELGTNVFAGIDQPNTELYVPEESVNEYKAAEQWNMFDIKYVSSVADTDTEHFVKAFFANNKLVVTSSLDISTVRIVSVSGIIANHTVANGKLVSIPAEQLTEQQYIIAITAKNGQVNTLKLSRH